MENGTLPRGAEIAVTSWLPLPALLAAFSTAPEATPAPDVRRRRAPDAPGDAPSRRVTVAFLRIVYDALPGPRRLALFVAGVSWSARGIRVESSPVAVGSETHRALVAAVVRHATRVYVETDEGARRCAWCGCTEDFACSGGCAWSTADRCSACRDRKAPEPTHALAPGALTPGALDTAASKRRGR